MHANVRSEVIEINLLGLSKPHFLSVAGCLFTLNISLMYPNAKQITKKQLSIALPLAVDMWVSFKYEGH